MIVERSWWYGEVGDLFYSLTMFYESLLIHPPLYLWFLHTKSLHCTWRVHWFRIFTMMVDVSYRQLLVCNFRLSRGFPVCLTGFRSRARGFPDLSYPVTGSAFHSFPGETDKMGFAQSGVPKYLTSFFVIHVPIGFLLFLNTWLNARNFVVN